MTNIIRFDCQGAWLKGIEQDKPVEYVEQKGMVVKKYVYSSFGACYFMEVENYKPDIYNVYVLIQTPPNKFDWNK